MKLDEPTIQYRASNELWLVHGELVASQPAYSHAYMKKSWSEARYFYCTECGEVWGIRIDPSQPTIKHYYYKSTCKSCGGDENMLTPFESRRLDILGANVLAYLFLKETQEVYNATH